MYFHYIVIISHWKRVRPFNWRILNPIHPRILCAKFSWNWSSGSGEEEEENVKSLQQQQRRRTTNKLKLSPYIMEWECCLEHILLQQSLYPYLRPLLLAIPCGRQNLPHYTVSLDVGEVCVLIVTSQKSADSYRRKTYRHFKVKYISIE